MSAKDSILGFSTGLIVVVLLAGSGCSKGDEANSGGERGGSGGEVSQSGGSGGQSGSSDFGGANSGGANQGGASNEATVGTSKLYAVAVQVFAEDTETSYVVLTEALTADTSLNLVNGVEVAGRALVASPGKGGPLYVGSNEAPIVTRYDLDSKGKLTKGNAVSFQSYGVAAIGEYQGQIQFARSDKAYYFDARTAQIVIFDPAAMTTKGTIDLSSLVLENQVMSFGPAPLRIDETIVVPVGWRGPQGTTVPKRTGVVVLDTKTDQVTLASDERCGYARDVARGADGFVYLATDAFASAVHRISETSAPKPCLLRFDLSQKRYDPNFYYALDTLVEGRTAGSLLSTTSGKTFLRVLDEDRVEIESDTVPRMLASANAWAYHQIELGETPHTTRVESDVRSGGSLLPFALSDKTFVPEFSGQTTTVLRDVSSGPGGRGLESSGLIFSIAELR
ncbi:MAG: hypothetical protein QM784_21265 [Polyangiaceae bacterium]